MDLLVQNNDFWRSLLIDLLVQNYDLWRSLFWISGFHCQPSFHGSPYGKVFFCSKRFLADWLAASLGGWGAGWLPRFQPSNYARATFPICMHLRYTDIFIGGDGNPIRRCTHIPIYELIPAFLNPIYRYTDIPLYRYTDIGISVYRYIGISVCCFGISVYRYIGISVSCIRIWVYRYIGISVYWFR